LKRPVLALLHDNPITLRDGRLTVDRKFHLGMLSYAQGIEAELITVHPLAQAGDATMDALTLPVAELPYRVLGAPDTLAALQGSDLVYGNALPWRAQIAQLGLPYVMLVEYDLSTQMIAARTSAPSAVKGLVRAARVAMNYRRRLVPALRAARMVHCNGYPTHEAYAPFNARRLLFLDSRIAAQDVLAEPALAARLAARSRRPLRLLYSGRYEPMKGALDAVRTAVACLQRGLAVEMDCYGQGSQAEAMRRVASAHAAAIRVHDAIAFPELVLRAREADVFVCCHIQSDPSCTYLESMGCGLPIVGYANRMWTAMQAASGGGTVASRNTPQAMADAIADWLARPQALATVSQRALAFARAHCFEAEYAKRMDSINALLREGAAGRSRSVGA
jgi:glycosyltransferase involved in cell wall biosynthesis